MIKITLRLNLYLKQEMFKVFSFSALSTVVKMLTGFVSIKVVAVIIGPVGIAILGQINNLSTIVMTAATGGLNSGIIKYVSEFKSAPNRLKIFISTAFYLILVLSLICSIVLISFPKYFCGLVRVDTQYSYVIAVLGLTILMYALNNFLLSILNGFKDYKKYVVIGIVNSFVGLAFTLVLVYCFRLEGALIASVSYQGISFFVTLLLLRKALWLKKDYFLARFSKTVMKKYGHYALMTFVNAATIPVSQIIIRTYAMDNLSIEDAGYWESMNRLSNMYLSIFTSSFLVYYLPRLSELRWGEDLKNEIIKAYKIITPILLISFTLIYLFRGFIVNLVFSSEFYAVRYLFLWQLIGDFLKMCSWILTFIMIAKSMTVKYILTELLCYGAFTLLALMFINLNGVVGITQAYALNYLMYLLLIMFIFRNLFRKNLINEEKTNRAYLFRLLSIRRK